MIINEFSIIIVARKRLRVGWGEKEKGPTMMIALDYTTILTRSNTPIIMAESNIQGITIHNVHLHYHFRVFNLTPSVSIGQKRVLITGYNNCI